MQPVHCLRESSGRYIDNSHSLDHHHDHRLANFIINIQNSSSKTWYTAKCLSFATTNFCYGKFGRCGCLLLLILKWKIWSTQLSFATNFAEKTFVGHMIWWWKENNRERERNEIEPVTQMTSHSLVLLATFLLMPPFPVP